MEACITHKLVQGSPEWKAVRVTKRCASEAAAMLGISPKTTRTELLDMKKTGIEKEFSDFVQEKVLDKGHRVEAMARPLIERAYDIDLYPATFSRGLLSASCDGITLNRKTAFEHKQWNAEYAELVRNNVMPDEHMPQCQQILLVTGAEKVIFTISDGTEDNFVHMIVRPDDIMFKQLLAGWEQFEKDLATHEVQAPEAKLIGRTPETLPALRVEVTGMVTASNLVAYKEHALAVLGGINKTLETDQQFADGDKTCKWCSSVESALKAAKQHALSQTESIDELFKTIDDIVAETRRVRLDLESTIEARKLQIKQDIIKESKQKYDAFIVDLNASLGGNYLAPQFQNIEQADFALAIKGKRTIQTQRDAAATELARVRIAAQDMHNRIQLNLEALEAVNEYAGMFPDRMGLASKDSEHLAAIIQNRVTAEKARQEAEREKVRADEAAKAVIAANKDTEEVIQEARKINALPSKMLDELSEIANTITVDTVANSAIIAAKVIPMTRQAEQTSYSLPTLNLGKITERLGFSVTADFLQALGFKAVTSNNAKLYHEANFPRICAALIAHIETVQARQAA